MRSFVALALCALTGLVVAPMADAQNPRLERVHEPRRQEVVDPGSFVPDFRKLERIAPDVRVLEDPAGHVPRLSSIGVEVYGVDELGASDPLGIEFSIRAPTGPTFRVWNGHEAHAALLIGAQPALLPFPGYGMVLVDPEAVPILVPFDANGEIVVPLDVTYPGLLGVRFYAQAWEFPTLRPSPGLELAIAHPDPQPMLTYEGPQFAASLCKAAMFDLKWYDVACCVSVPSTHYMFYVYSVEHEADVSRVTMLLVTPSPEDLLEPTRSVLHSTAFLGVPRPKVEVWIAKWQRNSSCIEVGLAAVFDVE